MPEIYDTLRKKVEQKRLLPGTVLENGATLEGGAVLSLNSATGGAELCTVKRFQGWSRFCSTFFSQCNANALTICIH